MPIMVAALRWVWFLSLLIAFGVGLVALHNWVYGEHVPLWLGPVTLLAFSAVMQLLLWCQRKGWIKGVFWNRPKELDDRKRALAAEREQILAEAAAKREPR